MSSYVNTYINFWEVKDNVALDYRSGDGPYICSLLGGRWDMCEIRNKAKELLKEYKCDGILYRVIRENIHRESVACYFMYCNKDGFHKQGYIDKLGLVFEPFTTLDGNKVTIPVGY